jgi:hypothetical protein
MSDMNLRSKLSISIITMVCLFVVGFLLGAAIFTGYFEYLNPGSVPDKISAPTWEDGKYWTYSFKTPDIDDAISRIVVASNDGTEYNVGVASRLDAQRHAVLNYNPMLGRIVMDDLLIYEKGIPQPLFSFPLKKNAFWTFSMFDIEEFFAEVKSIRAVDLSDGEQTFFADILAVAPTGERLTYSYDTEAQWIHSLILEGTPDTPLLEMKLVSYGMGFAGDIHFVRAVDIFDREYTSPEFDVQNTLIGTHPDWGPFNSIIYHLDVLTHENSGGTLVIKDPLSEIEAVRRVFGPNTFESSLGTIPSGSEELSTSVSLFGDSTLHLRIAGGIEYTWTM